METLKEIIDLLCGADGELRLIIATTLRMSFTSTLIATAIGIPLGALIGLFAFPGKQLAVRFCNTLMGLPPVLAGLLIFFLLSRSGPLGQYKLIYSVTAMVLAQILLITPIAAGLTQSIVAAKAPQIRETARGIGLSGARLLGYVLYECRRQFGSVLFTGFGRAISEVGAAQIVGGNIQFKTRILTTAIVQETNMGHFQKALALGLVLLVISFIITALAQFLLAEQET
ncbi:MAG: ABC transporter permease [Gracilibacteraceae bacterium]|nr:ABC transporter permease [Gracilibacteraceae bacterium]